MSAGHWMLNRPDSDDDLPYVLIIVLAIVLWLVHGCAAPPIEPACVPMDGPTPCPFTGGTVRSCAECQRDQVCFPTPCAYCNRFVLTGSAVPVHRFEGEWCEPFDPNETATVDCRGCATP